MKDAPLTFEEIAAFEAIFQGSITVAPEHDTERDAPLPPGVFSVREVRACLQRARPLRDPKDARQPRYLQTCTLWGNLQKGPNVAPLPRMPHGVSFGWRLLSTTVTKGDGNEWLFVWTWEQEARDFG